MTTYAALKKKIADLEQKAIEIRRKELAKVIAEIRAKMAAHDLTIEDIAAGMTVAKPGRKPRKSTIKNSGVPKYRDPVSGKTWTGHGKPPAWIVAATKAGNRDDFLITRSASTPVAKAVKSAPKAKPATKTKSVKKPTVKKAGPKAKPAIRVAKKAAVKPAKKVVAKKAVAKSAAPATGT